MEDPIKIIHKYKNNNGRIQYHIHIFIGDILDESCTKILQKIKDMDLYTSLVSLANREREIIEENYGDFWYEKFFNSYHIHNTKETTVTNTTKVRDLESIYGPEWFEEHFVNYIKRITTVTYSYEFMVKEERERKSAKKIMQAQQQDAEDLIFYSTTAGSRRNLVEEDAKRKSADEGSRRNLALALANDTNAGVNPSLANDSSAQTGGAYNIIGSQDVPFKIRDPAVDVSNQADWCTMDSSSSEDEANYNDFDTDSDDEVFEYDQSQGTIRQRGGQPSDLTLEDVVDSDEIADEELDAEFDTDPDSVDALFSEIDDMDKNIKLTTREIKEAISNEAYRKLNKKIAEFDSTNDNSMFDENLKDVVRKNYITHQYIYKDDTIRTIHNKICCGFKNDNKFGENTYIIPSYQYLWSEYTYRGSIEKIMIGQKWIVKNNVLPLEIEPNSNIGAYEDLRGNLKVLRDNIRRQGKIKREDDDNNILFDYEGYYTYNEIFMIDIYNELGLNYNPVFDELKNLVDVYLRIYFPRIRPDDLKHIIEYLNTGIPRDRKVTEKNKLSNVFDTLNNNLILENESMRDIELVKKTNKEYTNLFKENHVTQSFLRTYLLERDTKVDLFRVFDNFLLDENYPFIQYQPTDGTPRSRYNEEYIIKNERKEIIMKWFENSPYGISFKVRVDDVVIKYMSISLSDTGRIDYKIQWKEADMSTINDIKKTYPYVRELITKINSENSKYGIHLNVPTDDDFQFSFVNTIQRFELPENFIIDHNDLSEFSRYFFPYAALVIEPNKRQSKVRKDDLSQKSKFGSYLRYKRVSKYDNKSKIERRIMSFMKNYEYDDQSLTNEISKEFNITEEQAFEEIESVRNKYPNLKKSRKVLKKMETITKFKPPGIGVDVQGKARENYKIRIDGARSRAQLNRIISFMNILIYLYTETYLYKRPDRQKMKDRLKRLTRIARRRNRVDQLVFQEQIVKTVKQMISIDRKRLSYKADEDQNQWSRNCQNSGDDKKRQPQQYLSEDELMSMGYEWSEKLDGFQFGHYQKKVEIEVRAQGRKARRGAEKTKEVTLRAIKLPLDDSFIYYTCDPELNSKHMYIGFLNKSKNPYGEPMPCCFIKDHLYSKNKDKRKYYLQGIGAIKDDTASNSIAGDQLYILQDSNKVQEGRFAFLPKYLDIFMNYMLDNERNIRNHYLLSTPVGYYFKYGTRQDTFRYLNAVGSTLDLSIDQIRDSLLAAIEADADLTLFTSLNNGDIRAQFKTREAFALFLRTNEYLEYPLINDLLATPGVITKYGINVIIFQKKLRIIRRSLEKEKVKESYYVVCQNPENTVDLLDPQRSTIFIIKENKNYYPIIMVKKEDESSKEVTITKTFHFVPQTSGKPTTSPAKSRNIVNHILEYYQINCQSEYDTLIADSTAGNANAKQTVSHLSQLEPDAVQPQVQIIDARFKCKYIVTNGGFIIPVIPSGTVFNLPLASDLRPYVSNYKQTRSYLAKIDRLTESKLRLKPVGIYYKLKRGPNYSISAIMTSGLEAVPISPLTMTDAQIKQDRLQISHRHNYDEIDREIAQGADNIRVDDRIASVAKDKYETEIYQLFRFHLSYFLNHVPAGLKFKTKLEKIMSSTRLSKVERKVGIKRTLYKMADAGLAKTFEELVKRQGLVRTKQKGGEEIRRGGALVAPASSNLEFSRMRGGEIIHNKLAVADTPIKIQIEPSRSIEVIPQDFSTSDKRPHSNLKDTATTPDGTEFDYQAQADPPEAHPFYRNFVPEPPKTNFRPDNKKWTHVYPRTTPIDYPNFVLKNNRELCYASFDKDQCGSNQYCYWSKSNNQCLLDMRQDLLVESINKVAEEFVQQGLKAQEILRKGDYFVSDIVSYDVYTERPGERIVLASNTNLNKILAEIFGQENIPRIGKRRNRVTALQNYEQLNISNPIKNMGNWLVQNIVENNNTIFRAFANAYYWLTHPYSDTSIRNLGYYSQTQTNLSNIYKGQTIDWVLHPDNMEKLKQLSPWLPSKAIDFAIKLSSDIITQTNCVAELAALSSINETIIYVNDDNYNIVLALHPSRGVEYDRSRTNKQFNPSANSKYKKIINLRFRYTSRNAIPDVIEVLYLRSTAVKN